jgi:ABC-2 type transport system permease protein
MVTWSLAKKEFRLLLRDWRAALILVAMPLLFILVLGLLLGESFGQKPDDRIRVMILDLDHGQGLVPGQSWAEAVRKDLSETGDIRIELLDSKDQAERLVREHRQAAVLIFEPDFSARINRCSFLADGINPFHRDGVYLDKIGATLLKDDRQPGQAAIIEQVSQVTLLRVILPYMIGKAFARLHEREFIDLLGSAVRLPVPKVFQFVFGKDEQAVRTLSPCTVGLLAPPSGQGPLLAAAELFPGRTDQVRDNKAALNAFLSVAARLNRDKMSNYQVKVGDGVQKALAEQFKNYDLTGMTWDALTKSKDPRQRPPAEETKHVNQGGTGLLHRGAYRYQLLVPSYTVMFAFFLVMTVGWLFAAERRQGTLKRLRAAPITRGEVLFGKLVPVFLLSFGQGVLLLLAGRLVFGMRWGPAQWSLGEQVLWLLPVVTATSLAATGLSLLVAALARTEVQVALYGAVPVLVLALIGGCVLPREMMPEQTQWLTLLAPQGWALDAYRELLDPNPSYVPNLHIVVRGCAGLAAFGVAFIGLAWWRLPLD